MDVNKKQLSHLNNLIRMGQFKFIWNGPKYL